MTTIEEAERVRKNFCRRLERLTIKVRGGDEEAAIKLIDVMTEQNLALHKMGWMFNKDGERPRLIPYVPVKEADLTETQRILCRMRKGYKPTPEEWRVFSEGE